MSLASDFAKATAGTEALRPEGLRTGNCSADVTNAGGATLSTPPVAIALTPAEAFALGQWLVATFGGAQ